MILNLVSDVKLSQRRGVRKYRKKLTSLISHRVLEQFALISHTLSPPQRSLCIVRRLGRKKKRARRARFPIPIVPRALSIFSIIDVLMGIPSGSLCGGESHIQEKKHSIRQCLDKKNINERH